MLLSRLNCIYPTKDLKKRYAIVDLETTGGRASRDKVIEIGIVLHDGEKIIDTYHSMVDPETSIPYNITRITGITNDMVAGAPKFYEIAKEVVEWTEGAVFVAHNVRFDYSFLQEEFRRLGYPFIRRRLCTVRLSRQAFPGLRSYSLGKLIKHFGISVNDRHRALDDALATANLLERIFAQQHGNEQAQAIINLGIKEALLPKNISLETIHAIPEACGVYYFYNEAGDVIYVGKSINIQKRVAEHFANTKRKGARMQELVHDITYELTGSELMALLYESFEIKRLLPLLNRAQRRQKFPYAVHTWLDELGYQQFGIAKITVKTRPQYNILCTLPTLSSAKSKLMRVQEQHELCPQLCGLEAARTGPCFRYHLKQCIGACTQKETAEAYNERAAAAMLQLNRQYDESFLLLDTGRQLQEQTAILVENGQLIAMGYLDMDMPFQNLDEVKSLLPPVVGNSETTSIIRYFLSRNPTVKRISF